MSLIVQKFGGTSVANAERVMNVAKIVTDTFAKGNDVVVVVSAQGDFTDVLVDKQMEINPRARSSAITPPRCSAGRLVFRPLPPTPTPESREWIPPESAQRSTDTTSSS